MSTVVNSSELLDLFKGLGWTVPAADLAQSALSAGLPAAVLVAYLTALTAAPAGLNDQTINGVTPAQATQITQFLRGKGLVGV